MGKWLVGVSGIVLLFSSLFVFSSDFVSGFLMTIVGAVLVAWSLGLLEK